jgi:hypothetical protein
MLSIPETSRLSELEAVIEDNMQPFYSVGQALTEIREGRLYRQSHGNFEDYCIERWGFQRRYADRLIEAAKTIGDLSPNGTLQLPTSERQTRALALAPAEKRGEVWDRSVEAAGGKQPSARLIEETYQADLGTPPVPPSPIRITARGLEFVGEINDATLTDAMRALKLSKDGFHCALADLMRAGAEKLGEEAVGRALEVLEYDHDDAMRATALNTLPTAARALGLSASHYVVVVRAKELTTDAQRMDWLRRSKKHGLTPLQLRRSITAGKIVTSEDVQIASGRGSGVLTVQNGLFQLSQWYKHIQKADPINQWPPAKASECLDLFKTVFAIINDLMAASKKAG